MFVELNWNFNTYPKPVINNKQKYCWLPWAIRKKWNDKKKIDYSENDIQVSACQENQIPD